MSSGTLVTITYYYFLGCTGLPVRGVTATDTGEADKPQRGGMDVRMADVQEAVGAPVGHDRAAQRHT